MFIFLKCLHLWLYLREIIVNTGLFFFKLEWINIKVWWFSVGKYLIVLGSQGHTNYIFITFHVYLSLLSSGIWIPSVKETCENEDPSSRLNLDYLMGQDGHFSKKFWDQTEFQKQTNKGKQNKNSFYHGCLLNLFRVKKGRKCCCLSVHRLDFIVWGDISSHEVGEVLRIPLVI